MIRPRTRLVACLAAVIALGAAAPSAMADDDHYLMAPPGTCAHDSDTTAPLEAQRAAMYCLINHARSQSGLPTLNFCVSSSWCLRSSTIRKLLSSAQAKATDVRDCYWGDWTNDTFGSRPLPYTGHYACGRPMSYWLDYYGYTYGWSENITLGAPHDGRRAMNWWLKSTDHLAAILDPAATEMGVGMVAGDNLWGYGQFWVTHFGQR